MKTLKFPDRLNESIRDSRSFRQALERLENGKAATPRSWVYENVENPQDILSAWVKILSQSVDKDLKEILDWDLAKSAKFAPQGKVAPFNERQHTLQEYWAHLEDSPVFHTDLWAKAKARAVKSLGFNRSGSPTPIDAVIQRGLSEDKYSTSSGDPLFLKRKDSRAIEQARTAALDGSWVNYYPVLGSRASIGKTGVEARWIFMFPMSVNLKEQSLQQPIQDYLRKKKVPFFTPWEGYDAVQEKLSKVGKTVLKFGCDYSKMDQHFNLFHAMECFDVVKEFFRPEFHSELRDSIQFAFNCSVVAPHYLLAGPHAMPSGSGWTNFLETVFNYVLIQFIQMKYHLVFQNLLSMGIGDDQVWFLEFYGQVEKLVDLVVATFKEVGLDANPSKQEVSYDVIAFLQRRSDVNWSPFGVKWAGVYSTIRALTSEVFPEFFHDPKVWTAKTFALRCLMIAENCRFHPAYEQFVKFIAESNKNIVEFALSDDAKILEEWHRSKKIPHFLPSYVELSKQMIPTSFSSIRIIRNLYMGKN